jgi:hypothetical protein
MDFLDFIPIVPPNLPGERSPALTPSQRFVAGFGSTLFPIINFLLVLLTGWAFSFAIAFVVMPLVSAGIVFAISRRLATPMAWALVIAMGCATFCLIGNGCALLLHGLAQFFHDF